MTEKRLRQIAYEQGFDRSTMEGNNVHPMVLELLKAAVNEALEEAAEKAEAWVDDGGEWISSKVEAKVSKQSILNLKVK